LSENHKFLTLSVSRIAIENSSQFYSKVLRTNLSISNWDGGDSMIGAVVFVIAFVLFLLISLAIPGVPPGQTILNALVPDIYNPAVDPMYQQLAEGIINGVIYGVIIWIVYSVAINIYNQMRGPKEVVVKVETEK